MKIVIKIIIISLFLLTLSFLIIRSGKEYDFINVDYIAEIEEQIMSQTDAAKEHPAMEVKENFEESVLIEIEEVEEAKKEEIKNSVYYEVPFTAQAPFGEWKDPRQQDGCEEAASLMAVFWGLNKELNLELAKEEILNIANYQENKYSSYTDTSAEDTAERIIKGYFNYQKVKTAYNILKIDIINELYKGNILIVPANGRLLKNPYYTPPGPERHNLVVVGYDHEAKEFITNDPGTKNGKGYRYKEDLLFNAVRDYPTGDNLSINNELKAMIIVYK